MGFFPLQGSCFTFRKDADPNGQAGGFHQVSCIIPGNGLVIEALGGLRKGQDKR